MEGAKITSNCSTAVHAFRAFEGRQEGTRNSLSLPVAPHIHRRSLLMYYNRQPQLRSRPRNKKNSAKPREQPNPQGSSQHAAFHLHPPPTPHPTCRQPSPSLFPKNQHAHPRQSTNSTASKRPTTQSAGRRSAPKQPRQGLTRQDQQSNPTKPRPALRRNAHNLPERVDSLLGQSLPPFLQHHPP